MNYNLITYSFKLAFDSNGNFLRDKDGNISISTKGPLGSVRLSYYVKEFKTRTRLSFVSKRDFLGLYINLDPTLQQYIIYGDGFPQVTIMKNHYNLMYIPKGTCKFCVGKGWHSILMIHFAPEYLKMWEGEFPVISKFLEVVDMQMPASISAHQPVSTKMLKTLNQVLNNRFTGEARVLFLNSKITDLLTDCLTQISYFNKPVNGRYMLSDVTKVNEVKKCLLQKLDYPWSINLLASKFDIERSKLEREFKRQTGKTVFEFLSEERMKKAVALIHDTDMRIKQIALAIGYKNVSNFIEAFKDKFGCSPGALRHRDVLK